MNETLVLGGIIAAALLAGTGLLHLLPKLGRGGRAVAGTMTRAPGLDLVVTYFTVAPLIVGPIVAGWRGLAAGLAAQIVALLLWTFAHEITHPAARRGPRIVSAINAIVGPWRNYAALAVTAVVVPLFWFVRVAQIVLYPALVRLVRFPPYRSGEWINVSRQKFDGLVGHDLIWCLYCDWMTGVWSLGSEMLRNVETFWCPIRFASPEKCANCRIDFPDVEGGWVPATATMREVTAVIEAKHVDGMHGWFGHPARLTVEGAPVPAESAPDAPETPEAPEVTVLGRDRSRVP